MLGKVSHTLLHFILLQSPLKIESPYEASRIKNMRCVSANLVKLVLDGHISQKCAQ